MSSCDIRLMHAMLHLIAMQIYFARVTTMRPINGVLQVRIMVFISITIATLVPLLGTRPDTDLTLRLCVQMVIVVNTLIQITSAATIRKCTSLVFATIPSMVIAERVQRAHLHTLVK